MRTKLILMLLAAVFALPAFGFTTSSVMVSRKFNEPALKDPIFHGRESMYARVEVTDYALKDGKAQLDQDIQITTPKGFTVVDQKSVGGATFSDPNKPGSPAQLHSSFQFPKESTGLWSIKITVHDRVAGTSKTEEVKVDVRPAESPAP